ncbi:glycosyltransferase family 2 protein [Hallella multisaccharivorax]|uniref:Glycosyl transferase family 2 n=1 Tax=Hallella multisaccharivorax DSM 17128 TaxID=688246 RepID=F8N6Y7_9BACT|nr:glycosyltransferase family 2 protein [Hallella multisaccharivorax]EGN56285.1 glycosyl transferase family 2 [Hallella multisaccharivorax DSM 17128]
MKLTIIIPCYNEEEVLPWTLDKLAVLIDRLRMEADTEARLLLIDDGSHDRTWELIAEAAQAHDYVSGIRFSHNEGHQNALWAGMQESVATSDAVVSIDADLQDDENAIIDMARQVGQGADIVYGVRRKRETDTWFKRFTAQVFYRLMKSMDSEIVYNHADFRMMTRRAVEALMQYPERNLFLRGMVRQLGFNEGYTYYDRRARTAGESKYPLKKMLAFSIEGITSFSIAPLKFITFVGLTMTLISFVMIIFAIVRHAEGETTQGWTSLLVSLWFIGGIITTALGVTGMYIGKIYIEVKHRPRYFIQERA